MEELSVPVPDLYPELSDSLANLHDSYTEQGQMAKGLIPLSIIQLQSFVAHSFVNALIFSLLLFLGLEPTASVWYLFVRSVLRSVVRSSFVRLHYLLHLNYS